MNIKSIVLALLFQVIFISLPSYAADLAGSADTLGMLQKIQGSWRTKCRPVMSTKNAFSITKLSVSFTYFTFKTTEYKTGRCVHVIKKAEEKYKFGIRGAIPLVSGKDAFAVDFKEVNNFGSAGGIYSLNIIRFEDGQLFLGDDFVDPKGKRLTKLDLQVPFVR